MSVFDTATSNAVNSGAVTSQASSPRRLLATTFGLALVSSHALADDQSGTVVSKDDGHHAKATSLQRIEVNAAGVAPVSSKFTAPLINTPRTVDIVPAKLIQETGATTLQESLRSVAGITFGAGEGGSPVGDIPYIRGFDASSDIFIDGVRDTGAQSREAYDIQQIDVIKGASSVYTGRGAAGGSVNITTKSPELKNFSHLGLGVGSDSYRRGTFDGNYQLGAHTAARIDVMAQDANVPGRRSVGGHRSGIAPSISFGLGTANRLTLKYYHLYTDEMPDSGIPYNQTTGKPVHVARDSFYGLLDRDFRKTHADIGTLHFEHDFNEDWTLRETARYGRTSYNYIWTSPDDESGNVANGTVYRSPKSRIGATKNAVNQLDLLGNFNTGVVAHSVDFGVEIEHDQTSVDQYTVTAPAGLGGSKCTAALLAGNICTTVTSPDPHDAWRGTVARQGTPVWTRTNTRSAYALDTLTLSEHWLANLGVRFDSYSTAANGTNTRAANGPVGHFSYGSQNDLWSGQAGLIYKPVSNASLYASWATSSSPSGLANGEGDQRAEPSLSAYNVLAPQKSKNLEVGGKWDVLQQKLSLTAAVFRTEMTNAVIQTSASTYELAGKKKVEGYELGATGEPLPGWEITAGYTHLNPVLHASGPLAQSDGDGKQFPNVARNSASLWDSYRVTERLKLGLGIYAMARQYGNVTNTKSIPGYTRYDAMADFKVNSRLDLQLNVLNLTNKRYFTQAYAIAFADQAPARSAMLTANINL